MAALPSSGSPNKWVKVTQSYHDGEKSLSFGINWEENGAQVYLDVELRSDFSVIFSLSTLHEQETTDFIRTHDVELANMMISHHQPLDDTVFWWAHDATMMRDVLHRCFVRAERLAQV